MSYTKTILCLANSRKYQGRCVAGKVYHSSNFGEWIRPVTTRKWETIDPAEYTYNDGSIPRVLDLIEVPFIEHRPRECQTENHLMNTRQHWRKVGRLSWRDIEHCVDTSDTLWINGHSTKNGVNDRIPEDLAAKLRSSLLLIRARDFVVHVLTLEQPFGIVKRQVRAQFEVNGTPYNIVSTDLVIEQQCTQKKDGSYPVADAYICVSLGEPTEGFRYKLAAAIITPRRSE